MPDPRTELERIARNLEEKANFYAPGSAMLCLIDAILDNPEALDGICEYRARQINAERRRWETAEEVPAGVTIRTADSVNGFTWRRRDAETFEQSYDGVADGWTYQDSLTGTWPDGFSEVPE